MSSGGLPRQARRIDALDSHMLTLDLPFRRRAPPSENEENHGEQGQTCCWCRQRLHEILRELVLAVTTVRERR